MKLFYYIKVFLVLGFIVVEELAWNKVGLPVYNYVKSFRIMGRFKKWIENDVENRYLLLMIFINPLVYSEVFSFMAIAVFANGGILLGTILYALKLLMTIPLVIIFKAGKKQLLTFFTVKWGYVLILKFKRAKVFRYTKKLVREWKVSIKDFRDKHFPKDKTYSEIYDKIKK